MANTLRFKRGLASGLPTGLAGEPLFTTDTFDLYIGNGSGNTRFQKYIASGATTQILRGDGSLYTFPLAISSPSAGQVLKYNGTSWVNDSDAGITGSGSAGQVAYFTGATTQAGSNNLFWDATNNRLGIGTVSPFTKLDSLSTRTTTLNSIASFNTMPLSVTDDTAFATGVGGGINFRARLTSTSFSTYAAIWSFREVSTNSDYKGSLIFGTANNTNGYPEEAMRIFSTRNLGIGTGATDSGQRLQVIGTGYFSDSVGIGTTSFTAYNLRINKNITGGTTAFGTSNDGIVQTDVTSFAIYNHTSAQTAAGGTYANLAHYNANQGGIGGTLTNQFGFRAAATLTSATNNYGFYGDIAAATGRWNLYMNGTANNYMAGSLGIGTTSFTGYSLRVAKNITGATTSYGVSSDGVIQSDVTGQAFGFNTSLSTQAAAFTLPILSHYRADQGALGAGSAITTQYGFQVRSNLIGATNNYGFFGDIASGTGRWNLYMNGTALNYLNGSLLIGSTTDSGEKLQVTGTMKVTGASSFGGNLTVGNSLAVLYNVANSEAALFQRSGSYGAVIRLGRVGVTNSTTIDYPADGSFAVSTAGSERMRLDASGNLGLGITPAAWSLASLSAMQIQNGGFYGYSVNEVGVTSNSYYNAGWKYINSSFATQYSTFNGAHRWYNAPSGTAGNAITFTQAMTLDASGRLGVGTGANSLDAQIVTDGTTSSRINMRGGGTRWGTLYADAGLFAVASTSSIPLVLGTNDTEKMRITTNGNLHIGTYTSDSGEKLQVTGTAKFTSDISLISSANAVLTIDALSTNTAAFIFKRSGTEAGRIAFSNSANMIFHTGSAATQRMVIDGSTGAVSVVNNFAVDTNTLFVDATNNRVGIGTASPSDTLHVVGNILATGGGAFEIMNSSLANVTFVRATGGGTNVMSTASWGNNIAIGTETAHDLILASNNTERMRLSSNGFLQHTNATNPTASVVDSYLQYSADVTAGNAAPHFRTENGAVIKLYQETTAVGNAIISLGGGNAVLDDTTFDGYTLRQIVKALRNQGILQ